MTHRKNKVLFLLLLVLLKDKQCNAQPTAVISPRGYNASLKPEASFTFQCEVTGVDGIRWVVDGLVSTRPEIINRGISIEDLIVVDATTGRFRESISIERNVKNKNTFIRCIAENLLSAGTPSEPVLFKIQGLLEAPSNLMLSEGDNWLHMKRLSWDEPFSLDITDVDPDISYYKVCYSLVNVNKSQCVLVNQTEFMFPSVNLPLLFTVSAVNVVGEGNANSTFYDGNGCTNTTDLPIINTSQVQTRVSFSSNPVARFLFQWQLGDVSGITNCFPVYKIESSLVSAANTTDHGIQIPAVVQYSQSSIQLSLTVDSSLVVNEQYSVTVTAINTDGDRGHNMTVEFDTYDVQSVSGRAIAGGLELSCTFAEGSQAQNCILTIYRILESGMDRFIANITISREDQAQTRSGQVSRLEVGEYVIRKVTEVESDGQMTTHRRIDVLNLMINEPTATTTSESMLLTPETPSNGGVSESPIQTRTGAIVGGTVLAMLLFAGIIVTLIVFVIVAYRRQKLHHRNGETPQVVYEEPYDWAVSRLPQTEPVMEQCPAYGVLTK